MPQLLIIFLLLIQSIQPPHRLMPSAAEHQLVQSATLISPVFLFDPLSGLLGFLVGGPEVGANVKITHEIKNVDELRALVNDATGGIDQIIETTGGETRATLQKAKDLLSEYTRELDAIAGQRIADLDARLTAKLLWIQQYTEKVLSGVQEVITATQVATQEVIRTASSETKQILDTGGRIVQDTVRITGEEVRYTIVTAEGAAIHVTQQISQEAQATLRTAQDATQQIIHTASAETRQIIAQGGRIMQETIQVTGDEARFTLITAKASAIEVTQALSAEAQALLLLASQEAQTIIDKATSDISEIIEQTVDGLLEVEAQWKAGVLHIMKGTLVIVERSADLAVAIIATLLGLIFFFIASYGFVLAMLRWGLPAHRLARTLTIGLMTVTFLASLLPFVFISKTVRAQVLLPSNYVAAYAQHLEPTPNVTGFEPEVVVIQEGANNNPQRLVAHGHNLLAYGQPQAHFGTEALAVLGQTNARLEIDLMPLLNRDMGAGQIIISFSNAEGMAFSVPVSFVDAPTVTATPTPSPTATATPTPLPTLTATPVVHFVITSAQRVNIRSGPGNYPIVGSAVPGDQCVVSARHAAADWYQVTCPSVAGWIAGWLGNLVGEADLPLAYEPPLLDFPTTTPTPTPAVTIRLPATGQTVADIVTVIGDALVNNIASFTLQYGESHAPQAYSTPFAGGPTTGITNGVLGQWDTTGLKNGPHTLLLRVMDTTGNVYESTVYLMVVNQSATPTPTPVVANFAGTWSTNFAQLNLSQSSDQVTGNYVRYGETTAVSLSGNVIGNVLTGVAVAGDQHSTFRFVMDGNNSAFDGEWRGWGGSHQWCGVRSGPLPDGCGFSGHWWLFGSAMPVNAYADLVQTGNYVQGAYSNGSVDGIVSGWRLDGTWDTGNRGEFTWWLVNLSTDAFAGNWNDTQPWCGSRNGEQPVPCLQQ